MACWILHSIFSMPVKHNSFQIVKSTLLQIRFLFQIWLLIHTGVWEVLYSVKINILSFTTSLHLNIYIIKRFEYTFLILYIFDQEDKKYFFLQILRKIPIFSAAAGAKSINSQWYQFLCCSQYPIPNMWQVVSFISISNINKTVPCNHSAIYELLFDVQNYGYDL